MVGGNGSGKSTFLKLLTALYEPATGHIISLPEDGGPPIISASHWLELELRHWRSQLRLWMALPAE